MSRTFLDELTIVGKKLKTEINGLNNELDGKADAASIETTIQTSVSDYMKDNPVSTSYPVLTEEGDAVVSVDYPYGDIRRYGAVADGKTDCTTAFSNAVSLNDTVIIPEGTFLVDSVIPYNTQDKDGYRNGIIGKDNLTIKGEGIDKSIVLAGANMTLYLAPLMFVECDNLHVHDFTIDGNKEVISGDIYDQIRNMIIRSSSGVLVERCKFCHSWGTGISYNSLTYFTVKDSYFENIDSGINGAGSGYTKNMLVENCVFDGHDKSEPVVLEHGENLTIRKCFIDNKQNSNGFWVGRVRNVLIDDCIIKNCSCGIILNRICITDNGSNEIVQLPTDVIIQNNRFDNCYSAFKINGATAIRTISNVYYHSPIIIQDCTNYRSINDKYITYFDSETGTDYSKARAVRIGNFDSLSSSNYTLSAKNLFFENPVFDNSEGIANNDAVLINSANYVDGLIIQDAELTSCNTYTGSSATNYKEVESLEVATSSEMVSHANTLINTIFG